LEAFPSNLPVQVTSFVGRQEELANLVKNLAAHRLVTLTGVGGVGKTRLSLQVAAEVLPRFEDGVWFCELAMASDETLMFQTVADTVGARQREGMSVADSVVEYLRDRSVLVVLDNCEHLLTEAAWLASAFLQRCPNVTVLATSREGLGVPGEHLVAVPSLGVPTRSADTFSAVVSDAMQLFADRAEAVRPGFTLSSANVGPVAEICRRLDGMPLAIELAAARVSAMTPTEIAARLDERFRLLTGGRRGRVERHQTLRATVEWSYSLLTAIEQRVFDRLGVFVGGFDVTAAEAIVADDEVAGWDVVDAVSGLVEKSMVTAEPTEDGVTRYRLLETLRAFARERLDDASETDAWRRRHGGYYAEFCERAGPELVGSDRLAWVQRVEVELDNINAVLGWGLDAPDQADADIALRVVIALSNFGFGDYWRIGPWAEALLDRARTSTLPHRSVVVASAASSVANTQDDFDRGGQLAREALDMPGGADFAMTIALSYSVLGQVPYRRGRPQDALGILAEGHDALDAVHARPLLHGPLHGVSSLFHVVLGDLDAARSEAEAYLAIARATGDPNELVSALAFAGRAWFSADPTAALAAFEESIAVSPNRYMGAAITLALDGAAQLRAGLGDRPTALAHLRTSITFSHDVGGRVSLGISVERAIVTLARTGDDELAAICAGIIEKQTITAFRTLPQADRAADRVADRMDPHAYQAAFDRGASLGFREVAPTLLAELDRLLTEPTEPAERSVVGEHDG